MDTVLTEEWLKIDNKGVQIKVRILANASKNQIVGVHDGRLKIKITKPAVDGKANLELIRFLAKTFKCTKSEIEIIHGQQIKQKTIFIFGLDKKGLQSGLDFFIF